MATTPSISFVRWLLKCDTTMLVTKVLCVVSCPRCTAGPNIVGSCYISLHTTANVDTTTPNIVDPAVLGVVASIICVQLKECNFCFCGIVGTMINWKQWRENFQFQNHRWACSTLRFNPLALLALTVTNIKFLLTMSIHIQEKRFRELMKIAKMLDLLTK